jgi:hypothetical protein
LSLIPQSFNDKQRPVIERKIAENPDYAKALWTGKGSHNAIHWKLDGNTYSVSGLVAYMLDELTSIGAGSVGRSTGACRTAAPSMRSLRSCSPPRRSPMQTSLS